MQPGNWFQKFLVKINLNSQQRRKEQQKRHEEERKSLEGWDWERQDPDFYRRFHRTEQSKDPQIRAQVKWNRFQQVVNESGA